MKISILPLLFVLLILSSCGLVKRQGRVTILHTNDMHAQFVPVPATWVDTDPKPQIGGMVALEHAIRQARTMYPSSLLLDAGDICTGTLLSKIEYQGALNGGFVEMMNLLDYDAFTIGNHEFDDGQENLEKLLQMPAFDVLSANLFINGKQYAPHAFKIYKVGVIRIGVIGIILSDLYHVTAKNNLDNVKIADPAKAAQEIIDQIDAKTDLIVVLTHQGDEKDHALAASLKNADIIVGGHSHTRINSARRENNILIVQAGSKTRYLGRLTVDVAGDTISNYESELIPTWVDSVKTPDRQMEKLVKGFQTQIDAEYGQQIGTLKTAWKKNNYYETNLGNFLTDAIREYGDTDFAMLNSGGIRKSLPAGPITRLDVMEILPFSNYINTFQCSGRELLTILQRTIEGATKKESSIIQTSGIECKYKIRADSSIDILSTNVAGSPINSEKMYTGTSVDFLVDILKEQYTFENINTKPALLSDIVIQHIEKNPIVESRVEGRIQRVK